MENKTIIGIDFGTSATVITVKNYFDGMKNNECQPLLINGSPIIPSLVFKRDDGKLFFGQDAETAAEEEEGNLFKNFKMDLVSKDPQKKSQAQNLTREFFKYLYRQFDNQKRSLHVFDNQVTYVSYPAKWLSEVVVFMKHCASEAGFGTVDKNVFGEVEPTAAIYAALTLHEEELNKSGILSQNRPLNVMMLDLGAGTSDITIFRLLIDSDNKIHIGKDGQILSFPTIDSPFLCGGREIDDILQHYNETYLQDIASEDRNLDIYMEDNRSSTKSWKENVVSPKLNENEPISMPRHISRAIKNMRLRPDFVEKPYPVLTRDIFEDLTREAHWTHLRTLVVEAIENATKVIQGFTGPEDVDLIILTGGYSQWYCVRDLCLGDPIAGLPPIFFSKIMENPARLLVHERPQETVSHGLVYRDLSFDIRHTSANNMWVKVFLDDTEMSEMLKVVDSFDPLPITKKINLRKEIKKDSAFSLESVEMKCEVYYGSCLETAVKTTIKQAVPLNGLFILVSLVIFSPLALLTGGYNDTYCIFADLDIHLLEDGSAYVTVAFRSGSNLKAYRYTITL